MARNMGGISWFTRRPFENRVVVPSECEFAFGTVSRSGVIVCFILVEPTFRESLSPLR
jgi:hypothetical protein